MLSVYVQLWIMFQLITAKLLISFPIIFSRSLWLKLRQYFHLNSHLCPFYLITTIINILLVHSICLFVCGNKAVVIFFWKRCFCFLVVVPVEKDLKKSQCISISNVFSIWWGCVVLFSVFLVWFLSESAWSIIKREAEDCLYAGYTQFGVCG